LAGAPGSSRDTLEASNSPGRKDSYELETQPIIAAAAQSQIPDMRMLLALETTAETRGTEGED